MAAGKDIPHDLAQYVIEAATRCPNGFWGCVAHGARFKSMGRKRTRPGRAVIAEHRAELMASEHLAAEHMFRWRGGQTTDVTRALDQALQQWRALGAGQVLAFEWPSPVGTIQ